jgi:hypothetical protein
MLRIHLSGDHSDYHCGSAAAFEVLRLVAERYGTLVGPKESFDLLVVNGEGSMHHASRGCTRKIALIERALDQGRRAMLVNTVWQDNPPQLAAVLARCERVVARDVLSQSELGRQGVAAGTALDLSYYAPLDADAPFTDFHGGVVFTDFWSAEFEAFVRLNSKWAQGFSYIDMQAMSWSSLVRSLRTASLLVTGRHHAVYAACRARTPFLALGGNTHKIEGLIASSGAAVPVFTDFSVLRAALETSAIPTSALVELFDWMAHQPPWQLDVRLQP